MTRAEIVLRLLVSAALLACTIFYLVAARSFEPLAGYVPLLAGGGACVALTLIVLREIARLLKYSAGHRPVRLQTVEGDADIGLSRAVATASLKYVGYMLLLLLAVWLVGLLVAGPLFAAAFLWLDSRVSLRASLAVGLGTFLSFLILQEYLSFGLP